VAWGGGLCQGAVGSPNPSGCQSWGGARPGHKALSGGARRPGPPL